MTLSALFLGLLWLPVVGSLFPRDKLAQVNENRVLAPLPAWRAGPGAARNFISGFERYFNDHFGFRERLIHWGQTWKRQWFKTTLQTNVIIGREGWLYDGSSPELKGEVSGASAGFSPARLEAWRQLFAARRDWLARRGIHYLVVIPPDKQLIYPEYLPAWAASAGAAGSLDSFVAYMKRNADLDVLDLRPPLLEAKKTGRLYALTDSHWNQYGAFIASQAVLRALTRPSPDLEPLTLDCFDQNLRAEPGGNLARLLTSANTMVERDSPTLTPRSTLRAPEVTIKRVAGGQIFSAQNPGRQRTLLIFGDSFSQGLLPFLVQRFGDVVHCDFYSEHPSAAPNHFSPAHIWIPGIIEQSQPAVVIDEILDSFLRIEDPVVIRQMDGLDTARPAPAK
jgi:hypothetical protein